MFSKNELTSQMERLWKFAMRLTRDRNDADDLLQSTLERAMRKRKQFSKGTNLYGWCSKIMFNLFATRYRRQCRFGTLIDPQPEIDKVEVPGREFRLACCAELNKAWKELDDKHRVVLDCHCIKGMRYQDIAEKLDVPIGTVRSRVHRARKELDKYV